MLEWQLSTCSRKSDLTGLPFSDGDEVVCLLLVDPGGDLQRVNLAPGEEWPAPHGRPIARWKRRFRLDETKREEMLESVQETGELFFALLDGGPAEKQAADTDSDTIREALLHLLALFLERKRVLRPVGRIAADGRQTYRHPASGRSASVAVREIPPAVVDRYRSQIDQLLVG